MAAAIHCQLICTLERTLFRSAPDLIQPHWAGNKKCKAGRREALAGSRPVSDVGTFAVGFMSPPKHSEPHRPHADFRCFANVVQGSVGSPGQTLKPGTRSVLGPKQSQLATSGAHVSEAPSPSLASTPRLRSCRDDQDRPARHLRRVAFRRAPMTKPQRRSVDEPHQWVLQACCRQGRAQLSHPRP